MKERNKNAGGNDIAVFEQIIELFFTKWMLTNDIG